MTPTADKPADGARRRLRHRLVNLMDILARGAAPPGLIDMFPPKFVPSGTDALLRRRFTMIARFERNVGNNTRRWSATGLALSLLVGAVAFTGAVRGQSASGDKPAPAVDTAAEAKPAAAQAKPVTSAAKPAAPRSVAATAAEPKAVPSGDEPTAEDRAMEAQLARRVPELNFDAVALADVLDFLRDVSGVNLFVDWRALEAAGIDRNAPVTLRAKNVAFSQALDMVLQSASGGNVPLAYSTKSGVIQVSMGEQLDKDTEVRAYDVRDLVPAELEMKDLVTMVKDTVAPDTWRDAGGTVGTVHSTKHKLIITTTEQNHREIRNVLKLLREEPKDGPRTEAAASTAARPSARGQ